MSSLKLSTFIVLNAMICANAAHALPPYWENGSFLAPVPKAGTFAVVDVGERYGTWRVVGASGNVAWTSGSYTHGGLSFPAQGGTSKTWVNLAAISRTATGIAHAPVPTIVGQRYTLTFYVGNIVDPSGLYGTSSSVKVYENARLLGVSSNSSGAGTNTETWQQFSLAFDADALWTTIAFVNGDPPGDMNCGIDTVVFGPGAASRSKGF